MKPTMKPVPLKLPLKGMKPVLKPVDRPIGKSATLKVPMKPHFQVLKRTASTDKEIGKVALTRPEGKPAMIGSVRVNPQARTGIPNLAANAPENSMAHQPEGSVGVTGRPLPMDPSTRPFKPVPIPPTGESPRLKQSESPRPAQSPSSSTEFIKATPSAHPPQRLPPPVESVPVENPPPQQQTRPDEQPQLDIPAPIINNPPVATGLPPPPVESESLSVSNSSLPQPVLQHLDLDSSSVSSVAASDSASMTNLSDSRATGSNNNEEGQDLWAKVVLKNQASSSSQNLEEFMNRPRAVAAEPKETRTINITTAGGSCGKSALVVRWVHNRFTDIDEPTLEDSHKRVFETGGISYTVNILDTSGSDDYYSFHPTWFAKKKSDAFVLVFSLCAPDTLKLLNLFFENICKAWGSPDFPCILVGTQSDRTSARKISRRQGLDLARKFNCPFVEASAKEDSVDHIFETLIELTRWGGKPLDPFIHDYLYYGKDTNWKYLLQLPDTSGPPLIKQIDQNIEATVSPAVGLYRFPKNLDPSREGINEESLLASTRVFGQTLEHCMKAQSQTLPQLEVPRVFAHLIAEFLQRKDRTEEGIFRVPAVQKQVFDARDEIDRGNYEVIADVLDVHVVGALLKLWLRELADPLIPQFQYDSCIEEPITPDRAQEVFTSLHPLSQRIITDLFHFLRTIAEYQQTTKMGLDNLVLVFVPSFLRSPHTDPTRLMEAANLEKQFVLALEKVVPTPSVPKIGTLPHTLYLEREEKYINWYQDFFANDKSTVNFIAKTETGPVCISVAASEGRTKWRTLIETKDATQRSFISQTKDLEKAIPKAININITKLIKVKNQKKISRELAQFEEKSVQNVYKWGVIEHKKGQNENQMYQNEELSSGFKEFLNFIGKTVPLKGWKKYRGGLDVTKGSTGLNSVHIEFQEIEIMCHVAPYISANKNDEQRLERKRHLGNDIVLIVFKDHDEPWDPSMCRSEFNHIFCVVQPVGQDITGSTLRHYKVAFSNKTGVPPYGPPCTAPNIFPKGPELRNFLLTKLINGERAALHACPNFRAKIVSVRRTVLENLDKNFGKK